MVKNMQVVWCLWSLVFLGAFANPLPNVLFVVLDDLGWDDVGFRSQQIQTPNIDELGSNGVVLDQLYVQPVCTPTRASILTGRYPIRYGLQHYVISPGEPYGLNLNETLLPQFLKPLGYSTYAVGKWHLGFYSWPHTPTFRGFDSFYGFYSGGEQYFSHMHGGEGGMNGYDMRWESTPNCGPSCSKVAQEAKGIYSTTLFTSKAIEALEKHNSSSPFFMYLAFQAVHSPDQVPPSYVLPYKEKIMNAQRRTYAGMLSCADEGIGNITALLKQRGLWDNTLIIVTSDNGGALPNCSICGDANGARNWPLKGGKHSLWEGGVRATALLYGKMLPKSGFVYKGLMHAVDWLPTLLGMIKNQTGQSFSYSKTFGLPLDGYDLWQAISTNSSSPRKEVLLNIDPIHCRLGGDSCKQNKSDIAPNAAIRVGQWKLLQGQPGPPDQWQPPVNATKTTLTPTYLYDVIADPTEHVDLSSQHPDIVQQLGARLEQFRQQMFPPYTLPVDPASNPKNFGGVWTPWRRN